jgi:hypothetical protein
MRVEVASDRSNSKSQVHNSGKGKHPSILRNAPSWLNIMLPFPLFYNVWIHRMIQTIFDFEMKRIQLLAAEDLTSFIKQ